MNDYYDEFINVFGTSNPKVMISVFLKHKMPDNWMWYRDNMIAKYAHAIPCDGIIDQIVKLSPIIEMGAGNGYWAKLISDAGGDIIAIDNGETTEWTKTWFEILKGTPRLLHKYTERTLMLCWPPLMSNMAFNSLRHYKGNTVIHIGEGQHGCTGNNAFYELLEEQYELEREVQPPQWPGIHDYFEVWKRTEDDQ